MQPFQYDLPCSAARDNSITHAAVAPQNLVAATTLRFADISLQIAIELRTAALEITASKPDLDANAEECTILKAF